MKLLNKEQFPLPGGQGYMHLATVKDGLFSEYICFLNTHTDQVYVEEVRLSQKKDRTFADLIYIEDNNLHKKLISFLIKEGIIH